MASRQKLGRAWQLWSGLGPRQRLEPIRASVEVDLEGREIIPVEGVVVSNDIDAFASPAGNFDVDDSAGDLKAPGPTRDHSIETRIAEPLLNRELSKLSEEIASPRIRR